MKTNRRQFVKLASGLLVPATFCGLTGILRAGSAPSLNVSGTARVGSITRPAGGGSFAPTDIASLRLWVRASNDSGTNVSCYTDAGSTLATDGQTIQQWNDESGHANHLIQSTSTERPTWNSGVVNSKAALTAVRANSQHWDVPNALSGASAGEVFLLIMLNADPPANQSGWMQEGSSGFASFMDTDGIIYDDWGSTTRKNTVNPTPSFTSWRLYNVSSAANDWTQRVDGTQTFNTGTNTVSFNASFLCRSSGVYLDGKVAETCMFNEVLSSGDRTSMNDYIESKYGLTF